MANEPIVHIVDDDDGLRKALAFLMKSVRIPTQVHDSAESFLTTGLAGGAGCVVTDVRMPNMSGIDLLRELKKIASNLPVIVMTGHGDVPLAVEAMKLGAFDFIEKPFDDEILLSSVRSALGRGQQVAKREAERVKAQEKLDQLSPRERQVLDGLVMGHANKVIAFDLGISPRTVELYRANLMTKMEAASLSDLVRMALAAGILEPSQ
jgi:two-component system, LuxR family, response regulator FixJ